MIKHSFLSEDYMKLYFVNRKICDGGQLQRTRGHHCATGGTTPAL